MTPRQQWILSVMADWVSASSIQAVDSVPFLREKSGTLCGSLVIVSTIDGPIFINCETSEAAQAMRDQIARMANGEPMPIATAAAVN